jgi:hypothetical protein
MCPPPCSGHRDEADARERKQVQRIHVGGPDDAEDIPDAVGNEGLDEGLGGRHLLPAGDGEVLRVGHRVHRCSLWSRKADASPGIESLSVAHRRQFSFQHREESLMPTAGGIRERAREQ